MDLKDRLTFTLAPLLYRLYMGIVYLTSRKKEIGFEEIWDRVNRGERVIGALYHQDIVLAPYAFKGRNILTIASMSRDGEIITRIIEGLGFKVVRGSSSREGGRALRGMIESLKRGDALIAAITVDGPRGPAGKVKEGVILIAKRANAVIYPVICKARRNITLKNWDRTLIPLPFNHLIFRCGRPITVPKDINRRGLERIREEIERRLLTLTHTPFGG